MTEAHHIAGLPEWAPDAEAREAAAAVGGSAGNTAPEERAFSASATRAAYKAVAAYYWCAAAAAETPAAMRALSRRAQEAERWTDPVVAAVFEPCAPDARTVALGASISAEAAASARATVRAALARNVEERRRAARRPARPRISQKDRAAERAARQQARQEQEAAASAQRSAAHAERLQRAVAMAQSVMDALAEAVGGIVVDPVDLSTVTNSGGYISVGQWGTVLDEGGRVWTLRRHALDAALNRGVAWALTYRIEVG